MEAFNKNENIYDAYMTFLVKEECNLECSLINNHKNENMVLIEPKISENSKIFIYELKNLNIGMEYRYQCNAENTEILNLRFPKDHEGLTIPILSDFTNKGDALKTMTYINKNIQKYDAILSVSRFDLEKNSINEEELLELMYPVFSKLPLFINFDQPKTESQMESVIKKLHFPIKENGNSLFYSFDVKNAHFVSIPYEYLIKQLIEQENENIEIFENWIAEDLSKTNKKWKIVYTNKSLFCSDNENEDCEQINELKNILEDILHDNKVDLVISGGIDSYQRFFPTYKLEVDKESSSKDIEIYSNPKFPVYLICGNGKNSSNENSKIHNL